MINAMCYMLGLAVLCCAPAMAASGCMREPTGLRTVFFSGTEIDSLGRVSLASFRGVNLALDAVASSGPNTLSGRRSGHRTAMPTPSGALTTRSKCWASGFRST